MTKITNALSSKPFILDFHKRLLPLLTLRDTCNAPAVSPRGQGPECQGEPDCEAPAPAVPGPSPAPAVPSPGPSPGPLHLSATPLLPRVRGACVSANTSIYPHSYECAMRRHKQGFF